MSKHALKMQGQLQLKHFFFRKITMPHLTYSQCQFDITTLWKDTIFVYNNMAGMITLNLREQNQYYMPNLRIYYFPHNFLKYKYSYTMK